jgi:ATP-dependent DNA helicase RecG
VTERSSEVEAPAAARAVPAGRKFRQLANQRIDVLATVKPAKVKSLEAAGIATVLDLLTRYPRRYIDRTRQVDVADMAVGDEAVLLAEVRTARKLGNPRGKQRVELEVFDDSGELKVVFFNQPWRERQLASGSQVLLWGKLSEFRGMRQLVNPVVDLLVSTEESSLGRRQRMLRIVPVYPASAKAGLTSWDIGTWVEDALERAGAFADPVPAEDRRRLQIVDRTEALEKIHRPESIGDYDRARRRLAFDELLRVQLPLVMRRRALEAAARPIRHRVSALAQSGAAGQPGTPGEPALVEAFVAQLPFELTGAQVRAVNEIFADMAGPLPMHRLLQGDVGSGKTVVAAAALLAAVQGGHQGAFMVPTEVLAEQHYLELQSLTKGLVVTDASRLGGERPLGIGLRTSATPIADRRRITEELASGALDIVVGTHALLTDDVRFASLGLAVIDEQHRFGVEQRATLRAKGRGEADDAGGADPDLLVMTATPIPRTAAMVVFADLDITQLDELPAGRRPIETVWAQGDLEEAAAWECVRREVQAGHRAFVVCPLVDGSERIAARSATQERDRLADEALAGLRVGLLHGQMSTAEKEGVMDAFRTGAIEVLVATTVIEVGVDVPEATVMVIEDADRFGIAQLHQLRGRVGRSDLASWCYLLGESPTTDGTRRLEALASTTDGFLLAQVDLELRGMGTTFGRRQQGGSDVYWAWRRRERDLDELVAGSRQLAEEIVAEDPSLDEHPLLLDELALFLDEEARDFLFKS